MFIHRPDLTTHLKSAVRRSRIIALLGPRQCGKTTLAKSFAKNYSAKAAYYDLENTEDSALLKNPQTVLGAGKGLVIIDEIQRRPDLFPILRVLADRKPIPSKFLILGSASPELIRKSSESLAGRIEFIEMGGFSLNEVGVSNSMSCGCAAGCLIPFWPGLCAIVRFGVKILSGLLWSGMSLKWDSSFLHRLCAVFGK